MEIKMIVTDLDRTLLRSGGIISEYSVKTLLAWQQQGIIVAFATARSEDNCKRFTDVIKPDAMVTNGGANASAGSEVIYRAIIDAKTADQIILSCLDASNIGCITAYTNNGKYFVNKPIEVADHGWEDYVFQLADFSKGLGCSIQKIAVEIFDDITAPAIAASFPTVNVMQFTGERWFCFTDKAANKLAGVKAVASHMGIDLKNVVAFGDDFNDIEMLRGCGVGVAVDNAIDEAKAVADYICRSNDEDGVAKWLENC